MPKTVYVGMSGGVDSSVAAALLKKRGFNVVGVFMKPWQLSREGHEMPEPAGVVPYGDGEFCLWKQDREDALRSAAVIGIPLLTWDFSKEYKHSVTDYMIREYRAGRTPNPDVMCNKEIKFGLFLKRALKEGADLIATGHYVRKRGTQLWQAKDANKDQSYFLWTLTPEQLQYCLFPIGDYLKPKVRAMAKKLKLPNHTKKDSQGVCFIGPLDMKEFLTEHIKPKAGTIVDKEGRVIGTHDGIYYYTIGQRHGLNIGSGAGPFYVVKKDTKRNIIYVGDDRDVVDTEARIGKMNWLDEHKLPAVLGVKVRYRAPSVRATLNKKGILKFLKPERAVTAGQSAVFYHGRRLLGGGVIL